MALPVFTINYNVIYSTCLMTIKKARKRVENNTVFHFSILQYVCNKTLTKTWHYCLLVSVRLICRWFRNEARVNFLKIWAAASYSFIKSKLDCLINLLTTSMVSSKITHMLEEATKSFPSFSLESVKLIALFRSKSKLK